MCNIIQYIWVNSEIQKVVYAPVCCESYTFTRDKSKIDKAGS